MHFHPADTKEAFAPANKHSIGHLWYHIHFNQTEKVENYKKKYKTKNLKPYYNVSHEVKSISEKMMEQRLQAFVDLSSQVYVKLLEGKPIGRLVHGLGGGHVRETSLTIHPVYGVPFIPASSVKGVVRNWYIHAFCDGNEEDLAEDVLGSTIFGTQNRKGIIQFHDIFLIKDLSIEQDILTTHFKDYYGQRNAATDTQKLNLVPFLTVHVSSADIYLTTNKYVKTPCEYKTEELLEMVAQWTGIALREFGIGSKTSSGYGYFTEIHDVTDTKLKQFIEKRQMEIAQRKAKLVEERRRQEQERIQKEIEQKIAQMDEKERLLYQINHLENRQEDVLKSKNKLFDKVINQRNIDAALALKEFWQQTGDWNVKKKKKKQFEKVQAIKQLLNE
ncbi:type III-B CRISPR module RAMP protein Cmr6 [Bacillus sp. FJAT-47783]|uniref:type III-B CRISPR module RAMP protein Cmr6 n=1 Tax=Bacillus sp. FJAT-47783 TaxID=2922712 RepID=UPI001FAE105B|nr:type III-B CRISPR module RAMP protein Cmr6 [Bacillus sp. FJAT-47783]